MLNKKGVLRRMQFLSKYLFENFAKTTKNCLNIYCTLSPIFRTRLIGIKLNLSIISFVVNENILFNICVF